MTVLSMIHVLCSRLPTLFQHQDDLDPNYIFRNNWTNQSMHSVLHFLSLSREVQKFLTSAGMKMQVWVIFSPALYSVASQNQE